MKRTPVALAVAAAFGISTPADEASAIDIWVDLISAVSYGNMGTSLMNVSNSTATWSYNTSTGVVTGSGRYVGQTQLAPYIPGQLFTHNIWDPVFGGGKPAEATSYSCVEGSFGTAIYGSLCGNYNYGSNYTNETTTNWSGTSASKTSGGDDVQFGPQQTLSYYDGMEVTYLNSEWDPSEWWYGTTIWISNAVPLQGGYTLYFIGASDIQVLPPVVPVPAAFWLFGSALGVISLLRRHNA